MFCFSKEPCLRGLPGRHCRANSNLRLSGAAQPWLLLYSVDLIKHSIFNSPMARQSIWSHAAITFDPHFASGETPYLHMTMRIHCSRTFGCGCICFETCWQINSIATLSRISWFACGPCVMGTVLDSCSLT